MISSTASAFSKLGDFLAITCDTVDWLRTELVGCETDILSTCHVITLLLCLNDVLITSNSHTTYKSYAN